MKARLSRERCGDSLRRDAGRCATIARTVEQWSGDHIAALVATAVVAPLLVVGVRRRGDAWAVPVGRGLAVVILGGFV